MDDFIPTTEKTETQPQTRNHSSDVKVEEDLKNQNINTMIEIYGRDYIKKMGLIAQ